MDSLAYRDDKLVRIDEVAGLKRKLDEEREFSGELQKIARPNTVELVFIVVGVTALYAGVILALLVLAHLVF